MEQKQETMCPTSQENEVEESDDEKKPAYIRKLSKGTFTYDVHTELGGRGD